MKIKTETLRNYFFALLCFVSFNILIYVNNVLYRILIVCFCVFIYAYIFSHNRKISFQVNKFNRSWFIFVCVSVLSSLWAYYKVRPEDIMMLLLIGIVNLGISNYIKKESQLIIFLKTMIVCALILETYLVLRYGWATLISQRIDNDVLNSNVASSLFATGASLSVYIYFREKKLIYTIFAGILLLGTFLMGSKTGCFAVMIFTMVFFVLKDKDNFRRNLRNLVIMLLAIAVMVYAIFYIDFLYKILGRRVILFFESLQGQNVSRSTSIRLYLMSDGLRQFVKHPILGVGLSNYNYMNRYHTYAHSNIIEIAANLGIVGLLSFYGMQYQIVKKLVKVRNIESVHKAFIIAFLAVYTLYEFSTVYYSFFSDIFVLMMLYQYFEIEELQ